MKKYLNSFKYFFLRLKTPIFLLIFWFIYWGFKEGIATLSFAIGFFAFAFIIAHIIAKEIFRNYDWDVGDRLRSAWDKESKPQAILASAMLFARVAIYGIVIFSMILITGFLLRGSNSFIIDYPKKYVSCSISKTTSPANKTYTIIDILKEEKDKIWRDADIYILMGQIMQESSWREHVIRREPSGVISYGLFQVTDRTLNEMRKRHPTILDFEPAQMLNARYSIRAGILYDLIMWKSVTCKDTERRHYYYMLRAYNGGLGWLNREIRKAGCCDEYLVEASCMRKPVFCRINIEYPYKIFKYSIIYREKYE